jgi:hypothetical protein
MIYTGHRSDMWDVLSEARSWREFVRIALWWIRHRRFGGLRFKLRTIWYAAKSRLSKR